MAAVVSHAMRRYPSPPLDTGYSAYGLRGESSGSVSVLNKEIGESSLSKSMRYADPWLYGSVKASAGFVLTPAFMLCTCADYINGTKKLPKKGHQLCKKCKGARVGFAGECKFGTVKCYPTHQLPTNPAVRAGTVRVSSSHRPSILPSADPYNLMRISRLTVLDENTSHSRARSISPNRPRSKEIRSSSATRSKGTTAEVFSSPPGRRSILECDINPYELLSTEADQKDASITLVNGQRIRVRPQSCESNYRDALNVDERINGPNDKENAFSLKKSSCRNEISKTRTNSENNLFYTSNVTARDFNLVKDIPGKDNTERVSVDFKLFKNKNNFNERSHDKKSSAKIDEFLIDSNYENVSFHESVVRCGNSDYKDNNNIFLKTNEKETDCNRFKSILKKPTTFSDTDSVVSEQCPSPARNKSGSNFYLPIPGTPRKKVQFLVENELISRGPTEVDFSDHKKVDEDEEIPVIEDNIEAIDNEQLCKLRRSISERFSHEPRKVVFLDTMALRTKTRTNLGAAFSGKDLEKLDGAIPKSRRSSPCKERPKEPPPPPPKSMQKETPCIYNKEKEAENQRPTNEVLTNKSQCPTESETILLNKEVLTEESENIFPIIKKSDDFERNIVKINLNAVKLNYLDSENEPHPETFFSVETKNKFVLDNIEKKNAKIDLNAFNSTRKPDHLLDTCDINQYPENTIEMNSLQENKSEAADKTANTSLEGLFPPIVPPRKRSTNKIPQITLIQPSQTQEVKLNPKTNSYANKTVVEINAPSPMHKLQIKNEFADKIDLHYNSEMNNPQRKTSILINGDDCYSTVNVNDDVPLYQSSVVVKDCYDNVNSFANSKKSSTVYISGSFDCESEHHYTKCFIENDDRTITNDATDSNTNSNFASTTSGSNTDSHVSLKPYENNPSSSTDLKDFLNDPVEAIRRNLVPHVCGKSDVTRRSQRNKQFKTNTNQEFVKESQDDDINHNNCDNSFDKINYEFLVDDDRDFSSEHSSSTQYEFVDPGSDCYTDNSNRSSVTEEELATRTKFYDLLSDSAFVEVSENEDHHYESIKAETDPIYEEIEIPPPLPTNPPPPDLLDDLKIDKEFTTRSIFEGASKYDILSYLVDAKERGIVPEDSYTFSFPGGLINSETFNRTSHLGTVSDSSEENSLIINCPLIDDRVGFPKSSEIERNDSGVGSETSKSSLSKYRFKSEPTVVCEDCDISLDLACDTEPLLCKKCVKKRSERKEIILEIVETEEKYSRDLQIILEEFYQPMLVAGLLTPEQLSAIFLNVEELLENSQTLAERLRDAVDIAAEQGDEDLLTVNIGKIFLEAAPMLHAFETYCIRQGPASLLLASLEKEKELLRIFLRVSQMENTLLRRMNLNSFLMVPVQRVTKYPLLLNRLFKVTPGHYEIREQLKEAQHKIELHLNHMNSETRDVPSKLWRRIGSYSGRRSSVEVDLVNIKLRKIAVDVLEWNHEEAKFALEGKLLFTQPTDNNWRKGRTIKLSPINALLVINGRVSVSRSEKTDENGLIFSKHPGIREAALLLIRDKNGRYSLLRDPLYLDRCIIAADPAWQSYFEVQELISKDTFIFKAEDEDTTKTWYNQLQYHAQGMGAWRKRRNALANIMISGMGLRS